MSIIEHSLHTKNHWMSSIVIHMVLVKKKKYDEEDRPYVTVGHRAVLYCQHGKDQHVNDKRKYAEDIKEESDHPGTIKRRQLIQDSYKLDCPAKAHISRRILYTMHKLEKNTLWHKKLLRSKLTACSRDQLMFEEQFVLELPTIEAHDGHFTGKNAPGRQPLDARVGEKLVDLVKNEGITDTQTMEGHLKDFVRTQIYDRSTTPLSPNKRFFPDYKAIYNKIYSTLATELSSTDDQVNLKEYVASLNNSDDHRVFFRPLDNTLKENFLLVHQTKNQQDLMRRYGDEICLLDATYKTTKYSLPMFFVVVPTNTGYQVVGTFLVSAETTDSIKEALNTLSEWNPCWKPAYWMTDCCAAEHKAVESVFKDTYVLLCDFHRMQAWNRFLVKLDNGIPKSTAAILKRDFLIPLADSPTVADYKKNRERLLESTEWKAHPKFQMYMKQTWLSEEMCQRWVHCFKTERLLRSVRTNNGVESLNNSVKKFTKGPRQLNLVQFMKRLVSWHSRRYKKYCGDNRSLTTLNRRYNHRIPTALHQRPHRFVKHVWGRLTGAKQLGMHDYVMSAGENPRCSCPDFSRHSYPCKHIIKTWLTSDGELTIPQTLSNPWWTIDSSVIPEHYSDIEQPPSSSQDTSSTKKEHDDCAIEDEKPEIEEEHLILSKIHLQIRESIRQLTGFTYENQSIESANVMLSQLTDIKNGYLAGAKTVSNIPIVPASMVSSRPRKRKSIRTQDCDLKPRKRRPLKYTNQGLLSGFIVSDLKSCETLSQPDDDMRQPLSEQGFRWHTDSSPVNGQLDAAPIATIPIHNINQSCEPSTNSVANIEPIDTQGPSQDASADTTNAKPAADHNEKLAISLSLILDPHEQLDSDLITESLKLITKQHKDVVTQDCLLIQRKSCFEPALLFNHGDFCQVLYMKGANHWVSVTNIAAGDNDVRYFDSLGFTPTLKIFQAVATTGYKDDFHS